MSSPAISIIIPSYNSAAYLDATLASLASQDCNQFEVIVVDDQSSDQSVAVATAAITKYQLTGKVISRPLSLPQGVANGRNLGIKHASGAWVAFLDSDDLFLPAKISGTLQLIQKHGHNCGAYHHGIRQFIDETNETLSVTDRIGDAIPQDIFPELLQSNIITTSSVTIKKSIIDEIGGFDNSLHGVEDYLLWLRVARKTKWYYSGEIWTNYRVRKSSLMGGRKMTYYITQNNNLLRSAQSLPEFTKEDLATLEYNLFYKAMGYYSLVSLNTHGWGDFMKGLVALIKLGKPKLSISLFINHFRKLVLRTGHHLIYKKG